MPASLTFNSYRYIKYRTRFRQSGHSRSGHHEREFIEWVDPEIGRLCNVELRLTHTFGISLKDWLAVEQEGSDPVVVHARCRVG